MDQQTSVELLRKMLEIYSPSGKEQGLASFLRGELEELGFRGVRLDRAGNLYGEIGSGLSVVLLCGHMDTVPGRLPVKIEDNKLHGRGAVDAKSSLAAMISAASSLASHAINGKIVVAGVVEEERKANGIRQLLREGLSVDYAVFGEPSGVKNITFAYKGRLDLRITCKTVPGHVGAQHLLDNAIEKSFELWNRLRTSAERYESPRGVFHSLTPCLTGVKTRRTSGGVPDISILQVDLRLPPAIKCADGIGIMEEAVGDFQRENEKASVSLRVVDKVEPFVASKDSALMKALREAVLEVAGGPVRLLRKTGTGDMNIFGAETGVPVATYGPGDARLSHTPYECIDLTEYLTSIEVYRRMLEKILL